MDRRTATRMLCSELVDVHWVDGQGRRREALANLEDISASGVGLQMDTPLPLNTRLEIRHANGEFKGSVRYCLFREIGYFLGVQFEPGSHWSPRAYHPEHLLDLRRLVLGKGKPAITEDPEDPQASQ